MATTSSDATVIRAAAQWLVRLHSGQAGPDDVAACNHWRAADPAHERAWQKAERLARDFGSVPPALGMPVLSRQATSVNRRALLRTLAALGVAVPAIWSGWRHAPWQAWVADYATAKGERREIVLADGSRLTLNTDSAVDLAWSDSLRLVRLQRGEIHVRTAPDSADRPFVVDTPQSRLRALGTRFLVRLPSAQDTLLTVLEHRVEASPHNGGARVIVAAGQHAHITQDGVGAVQPHSALPGSAPDGEPGWLQGVLYADGMGLADFLAELSRYRPGVIRCAPEVAGLLISGGFQLADTDYVLATVQEILPVDVTLRTRWWVMVTPRGNAVSNAS